MEVLIAAATHSEVRPVIEFCATHWITNHDHSYTRGEVTVHFLITGPGMMRMAYGLGKVLTQTRPDLCINTGIAGAFPGKFNIGDVVNVITEIIADLGAEERDGSFLNLEEMQLEEDLSTSQGLVNQHASEFAFLPAANGITVNTSSGSQNTISALIKRYDPDVETMEGGAFVYCCLKEGIQFIQMRAISNIVAPRDKSKWQIPLAIERLNEQLTEMLQLLSG